MTSMCLTVTIFSVVSGKLASKISPKTFTLAGLVIYEATDIIGAQMKSIEGLSQAISYKVWLIVLGLVFVQVFSLAKPTNMSRFHISEQIGPVEMLGITMVLITGAGVVAGFMLPAVRKALGKRTAVVACII